MLKARIAKLPVIAAATVTSMEFAAFFALNENQGHDDFSGGINKMMMKMLNEDVLIEGCRHHVARVGGSAVKEVEAKGALEEPLPSSDVLLGGTICDDLNPDF